MMILVCGLSGGGKSSMIAALRSNEPSLVHLKASTLLEEAGRPIAQISMQDASANQNVLGSILEKAIPKDASLVLLDGHLLIETVDGPYIVPASALSHIKFDGIIFIAADPELLLHRRKSAGKTTSEEDLLRYMRLEERHAQEFAQRRGARYARVESGNLQDFEQALTDMLGK